MSRVYTRLGDDGSTGLLFGGRVTKADPLIRVLGSVDEAVAALGLARASCPDSDGSGRLLLRLQRDLFVVAADLACNPRQRPQAPGTSITRGSRDDRSAGGFH